MLQPEVQPQVLDGTQDAHVFGARTVDLAQLPANSSTEDQPTSLAHTNALTQPQSSPR